MRTVQVTRTYLEMRNPAELRGVLFNDPSARVERRAPCPVPLYRRLYKDVGEDWFWHSRLEWTDEQLGAHLAQPSVTVYELMVGSESAGYFELKRHDDRSVEIEYFGLRPRFIGRKLGGALLTRAVEEAWKLGASRVWLHTCTLDSDHALPNYKARGFAPFRNERLEVEIEDRKVIAERML